MAVSCHAKWQDDADVEADRAQQQGIFDGVSYFRQGEGLHSARQQNPAVDYFYSAAEHPSGGALWPNLHRRA